MPASRAVDSEAHVGEVGLKVVNLEASMTRPADTTAYASGDLIANSTVAGSVVPLEFAAGRIVGGSGRIERVHFRTARTGLSAGTPPTNGSVRVHLYDALPTVTNGDNAAWLSNKAANYLGSFDVTLAVAMSDGSCGVGVPTSGQGTAVHFDLPDGESKIYALIEARAALTPTSAEVYTVTLEVTQN